VTGRTDPHRWDRSPPDREVAPPGQERRHPVRQSAFADTATVVAALQTNHPPIRGRPPSKAVAPTRGATTNTADLENQLDEQQSSGSGGKVVKGDVAERFWSKVDRRSDRECWLWLGKNNGRYGYFSIGRRQVGAHRIAYELMVGAIPPGFVVHHVCRTTRCVNPQHLRADTQSANVLRDQSPPARNAVKRNCVHGHPFSGSNVRIYTRRSGEVERVCIRCEVTRNAAKRAKRRAAA
jgi:hypothetical protein